MNKERVLCRVSPNSGRILSVASPFNFEILLGLGFVEIIKSFVIFLIQVVSPIWEGVVRADTGGKEVFVKKIPTNSAGAGVCLHALDN